MNQETNVGSAGRGHASRLRGFTLIEVMISVVLVLLLTYGIAQVFKLSSETVGAQMAIAGMVRDHRAAVNVLTEDFRNCVNDSPLFLIDSQVAYDGFPETVNGVNVRRGFRAGFKNSQEETQSLDGNAIKDPTKYEVGGQTLTADFNTFSDRTPRLDRLGFFARGFYRRQTAGSSQVYSATTSTEAYIWIGHTAYPGRAGAAGTAYANGISMIIPQNQYAQDRILGRLAILLGDANSFRPGDSYLRTAQPPRTPLAPLDYDTQVFNGDPVTGPVQGSFQFGSAAFQSLTDLAAVSIDQWRSYANAAYSQTPTPPMPFLGWHNWYYPMDDDLSTMSDATTANDRIWRAYCQPTLQRPITAQKLAQTASCFIPHCTQFIVEYAGDYLAQNANDPADPGKVIGAGQMMNPNTGELGTGITDGEIDYYIDTSKDPALTTPGLWVKHIRWYGLPRDTNGDGVINLNDVLPLGDVMDAYGLTMNSATGPVASIAPWEKVLPTPGFTSAAIRGDYARFKVSSGQTPRNYRYVCAWHNAAPAMIRISMKFDDPAGKLQDGQWYEYILTR